MLRWLNFVVLGLVAGLPLTQVAAAPDDRVWIEMGCLVARNAGACEAGLRQLPTMARADILGNIGCGELKSLAACTLWGDALLAAKAGEDRVRATYQLGCDLQDVGACIKLMERLRLAAEQLKKEDLPAVRAQMDPLKSKVCDHQPADPASCHRAEQLLADLDKTGDAKFAPCTLKYTFFDKVSYQPTVGQTKDPEGLKGLGAREDCAKKCVTWMDKAFGEESLPVLHGVCEFGGQSLPPGLWKVSHAPDCKDNQPSVMGGDTKPLFSRCHCEANVRPPPSQVAEKFGAYGIGIAAFARRLGQGMRFRCAVRLFYDDPENARKNPATCASNLAALRKELDKLPANVNYDVDLGKLTCGAK